jgi:hypothetical protein
MTLDAKSLRKIALGAVLTGAVLGLPSPAQAEEVSPTGKGMVGTGLLGAELVCFGEAIFGVQSGWAYLIGGVVGAGAGVAGGYFIEKGSDDGRIPAYLLAAGVAGIIPAVVVTLDATRYRATEGAREDKPASDAPASDPGQPGGSSVVGAPTQPAPAATPAPATPPPAPGDSAPPSSGGGTGGGTQMQARRSNSLVGVQNGQLAIGVPVPEVRPLVGSAERMRMGVDNRGSELRFPVLNIAF